METKGRAREVGGRLRVSSETPKDGDASEAEHRSAVHATGSSWQQTGVTEAPMRKAELQGSAVVEAAFSVVRKVRRGEKR